MRIAKHFRKDQETLQRFLDVFGAGSAMLGGGNKNVQPGFFIHGSTFIHEYVDGNFFRKEELLMKTLEDAGFPVNSGVIGNMKDEHAKCRQAADLLSKAASDWQGGDAGARIEVGWAASEYTSTLRQNLDRLKNLVFPLLDQNIPPEDESAIIDGLNQIALENSKEIEAGKYTKLLETLEEELSDWK
ncbi:MAG TPA: hemerythrin domain-containing protein [Anaerolineales bacterium]|nr:hemerythrin domain-containing protein [Anaerolineales bacterium]